MHPALHRSPTASATPPRIGSARGVRIRVGMLATVALVAGGCVGTSSSQVDVAAPESPAETTSTTRAPDCAELLPPAAQAGQLLMVMVTSPELAADVLSSGQAGGLGLKGRQSSDVGDEVADAIADAPATPFVASDEEGGSVQRLGAALGDLPSAATMAEDTPEAAGTLVGEYATEMVGLGFNMVFAPVLDVGSGSDLGDRSFGDDPETVADFTAAVIAAQDDAGLLSVAKHWPGIGAGTIDPHDGLGALDSIEELRTRDLVPFDRAIAAGVPAIMVSHSVVPGLTADDEPASLSRAAITGELRGREGFSGLVLTDSLGMGAIVTSMTQAEAAVAAISAGADIALLSGTDVVSDANEALVEAITSATIPADQIVTSVRRVLDAKGITGQCLDLVAKMTALDTADSATTGSGTSGSGTSGSDTSDSGDVDTGINSTRSSG